MTAPARPRKAAARSRTTQELQRLWECDERGWKQPRDASLVLLALFAGAVAFHVKREQLSLTWQAFVDEHGIMGVMYFSIALNQGVYWLHSGLLCLLDFLHRPKYLFQRKLQPTVVVPREKLLSSLLQVVFNQTVIQLPFTYSYIVLLSPLRGCGLDAPLPTLATLIVHLIGCALLVELFFYYSHALMHLRLPYKLFHKQHHELSAPVGYAATYAHPVEHLVSNLFSVMTPPLLLGSHVLVWNIWTCLAIMNTVNSHCGYYIPGLPSPLGHDFHHSRNMGNYGVLGLLDRLHDTDKAYRVFLNKLHAYGKSE
eukprot:PLAT1531.1.p2 GENE.PLAT1531.1~~PLAT1531.1.p2  ORF type:complete len:319 (+),score=131.25 PLAT1531.1:24-959(+)